MAEYGSMFAVSGIADLLFLGGWSTGFLPFDLTDDASGGFFGNVINVVVFIVKGWLLVFVMMWVRWTLPRLRIDQVMMTCLKYLLPISCVLLLGVCAGNCWCPPVANIVTFMLSLGSLFSLIVLAISLLRPGNTAPRGELPGTVAASQEAAP